MSKLGLFGSIAAALMSFGPPRYVVNNFDRPEVEPIRKPRKPLMDTTPVIDTTKESKRARRRRLAKEGRHNG